MDLPAAAGLPLANVRWIFKAVRFRVRERRKRLHQGTKGDGPRWILPPGRKQDLRPRAEQEIGKSGILELTVQYPNRRLRKESFRGRSLFPRLTGLDSRK